MKKLGRLPKLAMAVVVLLLAITFLPALTYRKLANRNPLPGGFSKGVDHVHSTFSDGKGDLTEIASEAAAAGLDFVLLTDHGTPNRGSSTATAHIYLKAPSFAS